MSTRRPLFKHTIVIWAEEDFTAAEGEEPAGHWTDDPIAILAQEARSGSALCASFSAERVEDPSSDPAFPDTDFFNNPFDDDDDDEGAPPIDPSGLRTGLEDPFDDPHRPEHAAMENE